MRLPVIPWSNELEGILWKPTKHGRQKLRIQDEDQC